MARNGKYEFKCFISGVRIYDVDKFRCSIVSFSAALNQIYFGHIGVALLLLILVISIFGKIKENYRWFILNQVIWDLIISYEFICGNAIASYLTNEAKSCSLSYLFSYYFQNFIFESVHTNPYSALFLLSSSRLLALYFMNFYKKLTKGRRIFYTILIFNFICISIHVSALFQFFQGKRRDEINAIFYECRKGKSKAVCTKMVDSDMLNDFQLKIFNILYKIFACIGFIKPIIFLFLSILAAIMIFFKIIKQAKFRLKLNPKDFQSSLRISMVILLQTLINAFVLILEGTYNIQQIFEAIFNIPLLHSWNTGSECDDCWDFKLPPWFDSNLGLTSSLIIQTVIQLRIFFESIIVLLIMTGYREAIIDFIKCVYLVMKHPRKF